MTLKPKYSFIIVSWNVKKSLEKCIESITNNSYTNKEIIVIDNASTDESIGYLSANKKVVSVFNDTNIGFPKAVNLGLKISVGDIIVLLNPDTVLPSDFFEKSNQFYFVEFPQVGLMGPKLIDPTGNSQGSVFPEQTILTTIKEFWFNNSGLNSKYTPNTSSPIPVHAISGACMIMPRSTFEKVGFLTEEVFMYYEDLDYCRRCRNKNIPIYFNPLIQVIHEHGISSKKNKLSTNYLINSSIWYNGFFKHYIMWFISWTGQKIHSNKI